ncbi:class E sortase [Candidatus Saccharibacteria bacterium]|nr:class E sortase [Candidatus Saccharibacteria bacterium]
MSKDLTTRNTSEPNDKRRATIELARQKVMASFKGVPENYVEVEKVELPAEPKSNKRMEALEKIRRDREERKKRATIQEEVAAELEEKTDRFETKTYEKTFNDTTQAPRVNDQEWKKFHTAWQDYYQKYYEGYYASLASKSDIKRSVAKAERDTVDGEEEENSSAVDELRKKIRDNASESAKKVRKSRHFVPIIAGLAVILVFLFLQYNRFIFGAVRAYVMPGTAVAEIVEIDPTVSANVGLEPRLIIPKINVQAPIIFGIGWDHASQQNAMNYGVAHFSIPGANAMPGQVGNLVISGHSSGDVFDRGNYKFIFAQLGRIRNVGSTIFVEYGGVRYTYAVTRYEIVRPTDVNRLFLTGEEATKPMLTIITCWPIGTARERLLVFAEQISPNPADAEMSSGAIDGGGQQVITMPDATPTFFQRLWSFVTGNGW